MLGQHLTVSPEKPNPGETLTITYDKSQTPLAEEGKITAIAYLCKASGLPTAVILDLKGDGEKFKSSLATTDDIRSVFFVFKATEGDKVDNNGDKGYKTKMYSADKSKVAQGTYASLANAYGSYGSIMELPRDVTKGIKYNQKEVEYYPASRFDAEFLNAFARMAQRSKDEAVITAVKHILTELKAKRKATEQESMLAYRVSKILKDEEGAEVLAAKMRKKYRKGDLVRSEAETAIYEEKDLSKKVELFAAYKKKFANYEKLEQSLENLAYRVALSFGKENQWDQFNTYLVYLKNPSQKASLLNNFAWGLSGEAVDKEAKDIETASRLSKQSLDLIKGAMDDLADKPSYLTEEQWKQRLNGSYYMYADTYALILFKKGDKEKALAYQKKVCNQDGFVSGEMYERLAVFMEDVKGEAATEAFLAEKIRENNATEAMKKQHRRLFLASHSLEQAYDKYLAGLEKEASSKFREELIAKMINEDAPDFRLVDLAGKEVSLDDMKGKVVVLDFWATWCGPCKASFPGMQKMVDRYKESDKVAFLFIDTWESAKDKQKVVSDFINKHEYSFQVLMDTKDEVVAKYKVEGIPTKFVLDGKGKIRFKSVGFSGNDEALMTEMNLMIELAGGKADVDLTKADD